MSNKFLPIMISVAIIHSACAQAAEITFGDLISNVPTVRQGDPVAPIPPITTATTLSAAPVVHSIMGINGKYTISFMAQDSLVTLNQPGDINKGWEYSSVSNDDGRLSVILKDKKDGKKYRVAMPEASDDQDARSSSTSITGQISSPPIPVMANGSSY